MKRVYLLLLALLITSVAIAQSPSGRLPKTVVADVLAQMPAKNSDIYMQMMNDLVESGTEGLALLTGGMSPDGDNTAVSYAIGGLTYYVTTPGKEKERAAVEQAIIGALERASDREIKAFFIRQLQVVGTDASIDVLKKYAVGKELVQEAVAALTELQAAAAVESIFTQIPCKSIAAYAAGNLGLKSQEKLLQSWLMPSDVKQQKAVLYALSHVGGESSVALLRKAAQSVGYIFEPTGATESYLAILKRFPDKKEIAKLLKNSDANIRTAAIQIMAASEGKAALPYIEKALNDGDRAYRNAALVSAESFDDQDFYANLAASVSKMKPETATDVVNWLGTERAVCAVESVIPLLTSDCKELRTAAMAALARMNDPRGAVAMIKLFSNDNSELIGELKDVLVWYKSNQNKALVAALPTASAVGKVAIVELLSEKRATEAVGAILDLTSSKGVLADAAYAALTNVATSAQLDKICSMLDGGAPVGDAVGSILAKMPQAEALSIVKAKMKGKESLYYPVLSFVKSPEAFDIVKIGIANGDKAAAKAALAWSGFEASKTLFDMFKNTGSDEALAAYINLLGAVKFNDTQRLIYLRNALEIAKTAAQQNMLLEKIGSCNTFNALLLAGRYLDNVDTRHKAGTAVMQITLKDKEYAFWSDEQKALLEKFLAVRGGGDASYDKEAIKKYMAEAPSEIGFVSIFNGKDLSGWKGLVQNPIARAKMKPAELAAAQDKADEVMRNGWEVRDGVLYFTGKGDNLCTDKMYGDFEMYVDWKILPEGDAGIYLRGAPQVQVWDTTLRSVGAEVGSGGLYNNQKNQSKPLVLADNAIGDWNTFYIKMVGERVTVLLNGIKVVDNVILENYWDRKQPIFAVEQIELQAHGNEVAYRDIYVKELPQAAKFKLSEQEKADGFKVLFDGFSMNEWIGNTKDYVAEEGTITLYPNNGGGGNLYTKDEYADFIFRFEFMLTPAANNGLGIRTPLQGDAAYVGACELQILDSEHPVYKDLEVYQYHGSAYGIIPAKRGFLKPVGEWNYQEVEVKGSHIKVTLNGTVILDGDIAQASKNGTADRQHHPGLNNAKGHVAFLGHGSLVRFKNIRIKTL